MSTAWSIEVLTDYAEVAPRREFWIVRGEERHLLPVSEFTREVPHAAAQAWIAEGFPSVEAMGGRAGWPIEADKIELFHLRRKVRALEGDILSLKDAMDRSAWLSGIGEVVV